MRLSSQITYPIVIGQNSRIEAGEDCEKEQRVFFNRVGGCYSHYGNCFCRSDCGGLIAILMEMSPGEGSDL